MNVDGTSHLIVRKELVRDRSPFRSIFEAIEKYAKTQYGYASLSDVDQESPRAQNEMPR